jgi:hypothetical protein
MIGAARVPDDGGNGVFAHGAVERVGVEVLARARKVTLKRQDAG